MQRPCLIDHGEERLKAQNIQKSGRHLPKMYKIGIFHWAQEGFVTTSELRLLVLVLNQFMTVTKRRSGNNAMKQGFISS